ncbi:MAG TPA: ribosome recycling factor, partial [Firmicutes bacterium]|nr:ribosome recycling factor [Bacillota bacterium]
MNEVFNDTERKMEKSIDLLQKELVTLRAGRAVPSLLDKVQVDYY